MSYWVTAGVKCKATSVEKSEWVLQGCEHKCQDCIYKFSIKNSNKSKKKKWKKWMGGCNKAVTRDAPIAQTSINRHKVRLLHFLLFTFNFFIVGLLLNMSKVWKTLYWWISQFQLSILCGCGKPPYPASQPPKSQLNSQKPQICPKKSLIVLTKKMMF